jgi:hypothetical protein
MLLNIVRQALHNRIAWRSCCSVGCMLCMLYVLKEVKGCSCLLYRDGFCLVGWLPFMQGWCIFTSSCGQQQSVTVPACFNSCAHAHMSYDVLPALVCRLGTVLMRIHAFPCLSTDAPFACTVHKISRAMRRSNGAWLPAVQHMCRTIR